MSLKKRIRQLEKIAEAEDFKLTIYHISDTGVEKQTGDDESVVLTLAEYKQEIGKKQRANTIRVNVMWGLD